MSRRLECALILTAVGVLMIKLTIAFNTYGTNDALTFEADIAMLQSSGPEVLYRRGAEPLPGHLQPFSHPPPLIHGLMFLKRMEAVSGLPVRFWLRACCAMADLISVGVLWKFGIRSFVGLLLVIVAPMAIMISGFHVNTDPVMVCVVLSAAYCISRGRFSLAGIGLGAALAVKLTAAIFFPAILVAAGMKKGVQTLGIALACFYALALPFIWEFPRAIATSVIHYQSLYNFWGIAGVSLLPGAELLHSAYRLAGKFVTLGTILCVSAVTGQTQARDHILRTCGLSAALFLIFTPGFGVQYLIYLMPWLAVLPPRRSLPFYVASAAFLFAFYNWGSGGLPWFYADYFATRSMPPSVFYLGVLAWIAVVSAAVWFFRSLLTRGSMLRIG